MIISILIFLILILILIVIISFSLSRLIIKNILIEILSISIGNLGFLILLIRNFEILGIWYLKHLVFRKVVISTK